MIYQGNYIVKHYIQVEALKKTAKRFTVTYKHIDLKNLSKTNICHVGKKIKKYFTIANYREFHLNYLENDRMPHIQFVCIFIIALYYLS